MYNNEAKNLSSNLKTHIKETYITGTTDGNGNIYTDVRTSKYIILSAYTNDADAIICLTGDGSKYYFHLSSFNEQNIGSGTEKNIYYQYIAR